jgi:hypothetical protein
MKASSLALGLLAPLLVTVGAAAQTPAPSAAPAPDAPPAACYPACRVGYVCDAGRCIEACNPPCPTGMMCVAGPTCAPVSGAPFSQTGPAVPPAIPPAVPPLPGAPAGGSVAPAAVRVAPSAAPNSSNDSSFSLYANALGVLQFGPTFGFEIGTRNVSFNPRFRLINAGLLSHIVLAKSGDDQTLEFSWGASGTIRFYSSPNGNMRGFFLGPGLEFDAVRVEDKPKYQQAFNTKVIIPEIEGGYRWVWGNFLLDVGLLAGYSFVLDKNTEDLSGAKYGSSRTLSANEAESTIYGLGFVDLGFFL